MNFHVWRDWYAFTTKQQFIDAGWTFVEKDPLKPTSEDWINPETGRREYLHFTSDTQRDPDDVLDYKSWYENWGKPGFPTVFRADPNKYPSGRRRWTRNAKNGKRDSDGYIRDLKCKTAEREGLFPYVKGKGPAEFQSRRQMKSYMKRYGFQDAGPMREVD